MVARVRRLPFVTLGVTLILAAILFALQARRPKTYDAEVGLLITEGAFTADGRPRPRGELLAFINDAIFVEARLENLISKHDLTKKLGGASLTATAARMRKLIEVHTWHDYFESYRQRMDPPRSVRVTIAFSAPDPELALAVARDLGELVAQTQTARESEEGAARLDGLRAVAESTAVRAAYMHEQLDLTRRDAEKQPAGLVNVRLEQLARAAQVADVASKAAAAELVDAQLQSLATRRIGHLVQIVDPGLPLWKTVPHRERLARQAALSLLLAVFLAVVVVGTFHPTVLDEQDLQRAGLCMLGRVPACSDRSSHSEV